MKYVYVMILTAAAVLGILRARLTPWRLLSPGESDAIRTQVGQLQQQVAVRQQQPNRSSAWMWDEKYRTGLEKTTIIGRPEGAKARDH